MVFTVAVGGYELYTSFCSLSLDIVYAVVVMDVDDREGFLHKMRLYYR